MANILILDDDAASSALLRLEFKRARSDVSAYTVSDSRLLPTYLGAKSPIGKLRDAPHPQILVLPSAMPFHTGFEVLAWIRAQACFDTMFVVMLGSRIDPADRERAESAGVNAFYVRFPGKKKLVQLADDILQDYMRRASSVVETAHALAPRFVTAM